ncbi:MAG: hypothetical protein E6R03_03415 [Hyphomicrobiaceae bacterium]|nr:MAG: hypothetical protein E6R03_03415 [Hyphomicrobiaceae bacterium]
MSDTSISGPEWPIQRGSRVELTNGNWWMVHEGDGSYSATFIPRAEAVRYIQARVSDEALPKWKRFYYTTLAALC